MPDLADNESVEMKGSGAKPYVIKNTGGVYACTCPAWRNQSVPIERRTCKHIRKLRGDDEEEARIGGALPQKPVRPEGDPATVPPVLLAETWDGVQDLAGWWLSEKLDGVRAYWDGTQFLSRLGNLFHAPDWFVEGLPASPLDGELWIGRGSFSRTSGVVRRQDRTDHWKEVRYVVFDAPAAVGAVEERLAFVRETFALRNPAYASLLEHVRCEGAAHLDSELRRVEGLGGEGLMLRQPGSAYEAGRSSTLLKVKTFVEGEATVTGHQPGLGKHKGRTGALFARLANGVEFAVGTGLTDRERENPPPVGAVITFRYFELTEAGVPRFPSFVRTRTDGPVPAPLAARPAARIEEEPAAAPVSISKSVAPAVVPVAKEVPMSESTPEETATGGPRYYEFVDAKSSKFWEVSQSGSELTTRWGKIGAAGQSKTKPFADGAAAAKAVAKLIEEKTGEGYVEKPRPGA